MSDLTTEEIARLMKLHCMSVEEMKEAKQLFDHYYSFENSAEGKAEAKRVASASEARTSSPPGGRPDSGKESVEEKDSVVPQQTTMVRRLQVKGLEQFFKDLKIPKSALDITDLIDELSGPLHLLSKPRVVEGTQKEEDEGETHKEKSPLGVASEETAPESTQQWQTTRLGVTFPMFLSLLQMSFEEEGDDIRNEEFQEAFELLDVNKDGALTESDIRAAVHRLHYEESTSLFDSDHCLGRVANMHQAEVKVALAECDLDGDGLVTLDDVIGVLMHS